MFSRRISADRGRADADLRRRRPQRKERGEALLRRQFLGIVQHVGQFRGTRRPRTTAAATTGPASGPRPASSTPATRPPAASSNSRLGIRPC